MVCKRLLQVVESLGGIEESLLQDFVQSCGAQKAQTKKQLLGCWAKLVSG